MTTLLVIIHVIVCLALIMIVLLQTGKGADMGAAFGGGGSQTLFGASGASTFLTKATTAAAVIFMLTSLILAYKAGNRTSGSILTDQPAQEQTTTGSESNTPVFPATDTESAPAPSQSQSAPAADAPASAPTGQQDPSTTNP
jgi:preprotein translocase subunit SecG